MRALLKGLLPARSRLALREAFGRRTYAIRSYSQEGEDLLLLRLLGDVQHGVYVDVGAHHPFRFSNTQLLYERGWRGINIDARPGSARAFRRSRARDISLEVGVSRERTQLSFHLFAEPALNTFDAELARQRRDEGWKQQGTQTVECLPLAEILSRELPRLGVPTMDLLSVDVEGLDLEVLRSNDWQRFRPRAVVAEVLSASVSQMLESELASFLARVGYAPYAKLVNSVIFVRDDRRVDPSA
jgi:FkbM family methyltransferase